jgi:hypothetical protein
MAATGPACCLFGAANRSFAKRDNLQRNNLQEDDLQRGDCGEPIYKEPGSCDCIGATLNYAIEVESLFEKSSSLVFRVGAAQDKAIIEGAGGATGRGGARCTKRLIGWLQRPA